MKDKIINNTTYQLKLFVAGNEPNSALAKKIVNEVCSSYPKSNFDIEIIDVYNNYQKAIDNRIMVVPTLLVHTSQSEFKIVGSLNTNENLVNALGL